MFTPKQVYIESYIDFNKMFLWQCLIYLVSHGVRAGSKHSES